MKLTDSIRAAITAAGGTPKSSSLRGLLRQLVTAYGGTPKGRKVTALLAAAITASGGTASAHGVRDLLGQLVQTRGGSYAGNETMRELGEELAAGTPGPTLGLSNTSLNIGNPVSVTGVPAGQSVSASPAKAFIITGTGASTKLTATGDVTGAVALTLTPRGFPAQSIPVNIFNQTALNPNSASQPMSVAYSLRKVVTAYAGACLIARDSVGSTNRTLNFKADGTYDADPAVWSTYGDGINFTLHTWYDQSGNARNFTTSVRPKLVFPNAPTNYEGAYIDFDNKTQNMVTATGSEWLNVGGTANLSIFAVAGTWGWSSAGAHVRNPPSAYSGVVGPLLGIGTLGSEAGALVYGAYHNLGQTCMYAKKGELFVDQGTPSNDRNRNIWFNQKGAVVSGGGDRRLMFKDRPHEVAASGPHRLVLGNVGLVNQSHNGPVQEIILFQNATALSDDECQRIALWQRQYWTATTDVFFPDTYTMIYSGQSLAAFHWDNAQSGDGTANSNSGTRVFKPRIELLLSAASNPQMIFNYFGAATAYGGTSVIKEADARPAHDGYWWDHEANGGLGGPGPLLTLWATQFNSVPGLKYQKVAIVWAQGEAEAGYLRDNASPPFTVADHKAQTKQVFQWMRDFIGYNCPIFIQPLRSPTGFAPAYMAALHDAQNSIAGEMVDVYLAPETADVTLAADGVHYAKIPIETGFDLVATRNADTVATVLMSLPSR